jgi:uncharacterized delta-60 repeat protein
MKFLLQTLFFFLLITQICFAQLNQQSNDNVEVAWVRHYASEKIASGDKAFAIIEDLNGSIIVAGNSGPDIVTIKYNENGDTLWTRRFKGPGQFTGLGVPVSLAVDQLGNIYVAGGCENPNTALDFIIIKYSGNGDTLWTRYYSSPTEAVDYAVGILVDSEFNVYVVGARSINTPPQPYIIKYDQLGNVLWQEKIESFIMGDGKIAIALDPEENIIAMKPGELHKLDRNTGNTIWSSYIGDRANAECLAVDGSGNIYLNGTSGQQYLTSKFDNDGSIVWQTFHNVGDPYPYAYPYAYAHSLIDVDNLQNVYVSGCSNDDYITTKIDINGNILWEKSYAGPNIGEGHPCKIDIDGDGNVYVTGTDQNDIATLKYDTNGNTLWVKRFHGNSNGNDEASDLIIDGNGDVLVTGGSFDSESDFDFITLKYSAIGDSLWCKSFDGIPNSYDQATSLSLDVNGNAYVTGVSNCKTTKQDYATIKYNSTGDLLWVNRYDGPTNISDRPTSIAVDADQNVYVTGQSSSSYATIKYDVDGNFIWQQRYSSITKGGASALSITSNNEIIVTGSSDNDNVTIKYNSQGLPIWTTRYHFPGNVYNAATLKIDLGGNSYVTGATGVGNGRGSTRDYATVKYNANGDTVWTRIYNEGSWDEANSLVYDVDGNVYVTGHSDGNYATIKYNEYGDTLWVRKYNGPADGYDVAISIELDLNGNVIVSGSSDGVSTGLDYCTIKYNSNGDTVWLRRYNGPGNGDDEVLAMALDAAGNIYVVGKSTSVNGDFDICIIKYSNGGDVEWISRYDATGVSDEQLADDYPSSIQITSDQVVYVLGCSEWPALNRCVYTLIRLNQTQTDIGSELGLKPEKFLLSQNYPNPFNPSTTIRYSIPRLSKVEMTLFNLLGEKIKTLVDEEKMPGSYEVGINAANLSSGIYFYQLKAGDFIQTKKMILLK